MIQMESFAAIVALLIVTTVPMVLMVSSGAAHQQIDPAAAAAAEAGMHILIPSQRQLSYDVSLGRYCNKVGYIDVLIWRATVYRLCGIYSKI